MTISREAAGGPTSPTPSGRRRRGFLGHGGGGEAEGEDLKARELVANWEERKLVWESGKIRSRKDGIVWVELMSCCVS